MNNAFLSTFSVPGTVLCPSMTDQASGLWTGPTTKQGNKGKELVTFAISVLIFTGEGVQGSGS